MIHDEPTVHDAVGAIGGNYEQDYYEDEDQETIRYNQVQSGTIRYNQVQSGTIRYI